MVYPARGRAEQLLFAAAAAGLAIAVFGFFWSATASTAPPARRAYDMAGITPQNVGKLQRAWEVHTGDVSDGTEKIPLSDWSATPLCVNHTV